MYNTLYIKVYKIEVFYAFIHLNRFVTNEIIKIIFSETCFKLRHRDCFLIYFELNTALKKNEKVKCLKTSNVSE